MKGLQEKDFQNHIQNYLVNHGYVKGYTENYQKEYCVDEKCLFDFLYRTQPESMEHLESIYRENTRNYFMLKLSEAIKEKNPIKILKEGIELENKRFLLAYFKPYSGLNNEIVALYEKNIVSITDELEYHKERKFRLDFCIFINGIPVAIFELKNEATGQSYAHAQNQLKYDRDPKEELFKRTPVFFAMDTREAYMTTKLEGENTFFLPFNKGNEEGKGNPIVDGKFATHYVWETIIQKDNLLELVKDFMYVDEERQSFIFPRYHQIDAVREIRANLLSNQPNDNFLIKHSAGSGKTNTITWTAYMLSKLFINDQKLFDSVLVLTDRVVLDKQLQDNIALIDHKSGVVKTIEGKSKELADALNNNTHIIVTTIQKFGHIYDSLKTLNGKRFAIIIDEAHQSQTGQYQANVKRALNKEDVDTEDKVLAEIKKLGKADNIKFFAFTATPKKETLEMFGVHDESDNTYKPFHLYSMKQAIEEGFILDVLQNYTYYQMYYKLVSKSNETLLVDRRTAKRDIRNYLNIQSIAEKVPIIVNHFNDKAQYLLNGKGKAMVVTESREQAILYFFAINQYIKDLKLPFKTIVAFSDTVKVNGTDYSEESLNGFKSGEIPDKFTSDEYQILIVANKFQTGFDEKKLVAMYVDKKLKGINAVQTLSRLNRVTKGKTDTFILDFKNHPEEIKQAFAEHFLGAEIPNEDYHEEFLDRAYERVLSFKVITKETLTDFSKEFFSKKNYEKIEPVLQTAKDRYKALSMEEKKNFTHILQKYIDVFNYVKLLQPMKKEEIVNLYLVSINVLKMTETEEDTNTLLRTRRIQEISDVVDIQTLGFVKKFEGDLELSTDEELESHKLGLKSVSLAEENIASLDDLLNELNQDSATSELAIKYEIQIKQIMDELNGEDTILEVVKRKENKYEDIKGALEGLISGNIMPRLKDSFYKEFIKHLMKQKESKVRFVEKIAQNLYLKYHE
ncbi:restriction endonuclease subunit R [Bacillus sp. M6-12]|uniref:type I restriction endonuclease subunit R n=1 Tax=Bacillus sp. M6-12 TaxID=2054166 RepID=UPI000C78BC48|nr:DEAD/DEAH box helicase family protein [Bacillus sp. M6-12]PLS18954.1 restriction endonuclease subunit R [Bacillus sp. M6-12]